MFSKPDMAASISGDNPVEYSLKTYKEYLSNERIK